MGDFGLVELRRSPLSSSLQALARCSRLRQRALNMSGRLEGGQMFSATMRDIMQDHYGVEIGPYSYGGCFTPGQLPPGVRVGRYVSVAKNVQAFVRNHPYERLSMHPFFYNAACGYVAQDNIASSTLEIGHDAWLASNAIILPGCHRIGIGAVVAAGAVVVKDVPDFAIVGGNPAKVLKMRFEPAICEKLLASEWWMKPIDDLAASIELWIKPFEPSMLNHPCLQQEVSDTSKEEV